MQIISGDRAYGRPGKHLAGKYIRLSYAIWKKVTRAACLKLIAYKGEEQQQKLPFPLQICNYNTKLNKRSSEILKPLTRKILELS